VSLTLVRDVRDTVTTVAVTGEIDRSSVSRFDAALRAEIVAATTGSLVLDLAGTTTIDWAVVGTIVAVRNLARQHRVRFQITGVDGQVRTVFDASGVTRFLVPDP
jgi:anti-anti-sigma factor